MHLIDIIVTVVVLGIFVGLPFYFKRQGALDITSNNEYCEHCGSKLIENINNSLHADFICPLHGRYYQKED